MQPLLRNTFPRNRLEYNNKRCFLHGLCQGVINGTSLEVSQWGGCQRGCYIRTTIASVQLENKINSCESQGLVAKMNLLVVNCQS
jgi:hypothetical protein